MKRILLFALIFSLLFFLKPFSANQAFAQACNNNNDCPSGFFCDLDDFCSPNRATPTPTRTPTPTISPSPTQTPPTPTSQVSNAPLHSSTCQQVSNNPHDENNSSLQGTCPNGQECRLTTGEQGETFLSCVESGSITPEPTNDVICAPGQLTNDGVCHSIDTAIGPIQTDIKAFINQLFTIVLGLSGGIALLLIIISGYKMMASRGNPEQINAAREQLTAAIVGLLFIIFAFVILEVIGVDLLRIPGFSS